jgi:hypothetical protein
MLTDIIIRQTLQHGILTTDRDGDNLREHKDQDQHDRIEEQRLLRFVQPTFQDRSEGDESPGQSSQGPEGTQAIEILQADFGTRGREGEASKLHHENENEIKKKKKKKI